MYICQVNVFSSSWFWLWFFSNTNTPALWWRKHMEMLSAMLAFVRGVHWSAEVFCLEKALMWSFHDDVTKWKHFPRYWPFVRGIHRWPVNSPPKGQWPENLMFTLICSWINGWVNNGEAGDLRRYCAHYDVTVTWCFCLLFVWTTSCWFETPWRPCDAPVMALVADYMAPYRCQAASPYTLGANARGCRLTPSSRLRTPF